MTNLLKKYKEETIGVMKTKFGRTNTLSLPNFEKIVVNVGLGEALKNSAAIDKVINDLTDIVGQKPITRKSKKAISNFSLRVGDIVGVTATLRGDRMWDFYDRLVNLSLPRVKDFRGVSKKAFDKKGNYTLGISDMSIFPEYDNTNLDKIRGMEITVVINNSTPEESLFLLESLGMPFEKTH